MRHDLGVTNSRLDADFSDAEELQEVEGLPQPLRRNGRSTFEEFPGGMRRNREVLTGMSDEQRPRV